MAEGVLFRFIERFQRGYAFGGGRRVGGLDRVGECQRFKSWSFPVWVRRSYLAILE